MPPGSLVIDISQAQAPDDIDWQAVKASGIKGVMVRASQGVRESVPVGVDTAFSRHIEGALAVGLPVGVYHAFIASRNGTAQAQFFTETVAPYLDRLSFPLAIDVELDNGQTPDAITTRLFDMVTALAARGHGLPMIYTSAGFWQAHTTPEHDAYFGRLPLWVAHWTNAEKPLLPRGWSEYALWQYGKTEVSGQLVDINRTPPHSEKFTLLHPVQAPVNINARNLFGAHPERYKQFGLSGHDGLDYSLALNAPVYAAADGVVKLIAPDNGEHPYGAHIRITSKVGAEAYEHIYAHLNKFVVGLKQGDSVEAGQQIGYAGSTGNSDGVHLHFAVKWLGATARGFKQKLADGRELVFEKDLVDPTLFLVT